MNESSIYFFPGGGHDHDGENSSLIDTNVYSIFDFGWEIFGDPNRQNRQTLNYNGFRQFVVDTVNQSIIQPAGVVFQEGVINGNAHIITGSITSNEIAANTITANNILAGTITANLLSANIVLVDQIIASNNYVAGVSGWKIDGDGTAEFDSASIRGAISAAAVVIDANNAWDNTGFVLGGNTGIYTSNGVIHIGTSVVIEGAIVADEIAIDGNNYWLSNGVFRVGNNSNVLYFDGTDLALTGNVTTSNLVADGGSIAGFTINQDYLSYGNLLLGLGAGYGGTWEGASVNINGRMAGFWAQDSYGASDALLYCGSDNGGAYFKSQYDIEGNMSTETSGYILAIGQICSISGLTTGDLLNPDSTLDSDLVTNDVYCNEVITDGVYYNASNLSGDRYPVAFGWDQGGYLSCIINNDTNVDPYFAPDGYYSDRRLKENIINVSDDLLQKLYSVKTYEFTYKQDIPYPWIAGKNGIGVIADEFAQLFPEYVENIDNVNKYQQVVYVKSIPLLLAAISDLNQRIKALEQQLGYNS